MLVGELREFTLIWMYLALSRISLSPKVYRVVSRYGVLPAALATCPPVVIECDLVLNTPPGLHAQKGII